MASGWDDLPNNSRHSSEEVSVIEIERRAEGLINCYNISTISYKIMI